MAMMASSFLFSLPEEAKVVPCPVNWISELIPHLESSVREDMGSLQNYLERRISRTLEVVGTDREDGERGLQGINEESLLGEIFCFAVSNIAISLDMASFYTYLRDFGHARLHLEEGQDKLAGAGDGELEEGHVTVIQYCLDATEWVIKLLEHFRDNEGDGADGVAGGIPEEIAAEAERLQMQWLEFQDDGQCTATIAFQKGFLAGGLQVKEEEILKKFEEASELEPTHYVWAYYAYKKVRFIRRNCREDRQLTSPDEMEHRFCQRAYELRPDCLTNIINYALLLKERLWIEPKAFWCENVESVRNCDDMFKKALRVAERDETQNGRFWLRKLKMYYGDFLVFGKHPCLDTQHGKEMFEEVKEVCPDDSFVLHKLGKLHHRGTFCTGDYIDLTAAKEYYVLALRNDFNFPCLMDYLRLLKETESYQDMISEIDKFLAHFVAHSLRELYIVQLLIERGCVIWLFDPFHSDSNTRKRQACEPWIRALVKFPNRAENVYNQVNRRYERQLRRRPRRIPALEVSETLAAIRRDSTESDAEIAAIDAWLQKLLPRPLDRNGNAGNGPIYLPPHRRQAVAGLMDGVRELRLNERDRNGRDDDINPPRE